jgi:hypothetical protein
MLTSLTTGPCLGLSPGLVPAGDGHHDVTWLQREHPGGFRTDQGVSPAMRRFLDSVSSMLADDDSYTYGTAFLHVIHANGVSSGAFHYDSGYDRPVLNSNVGAPVLRFAAAYATDDEPVSYVFSSDHGHFGCQVSDLLGDSALTQPPNNHVIAYAEGTGLHGVAAGRPRPGAVTMIFSASLYQSFQIPTLIPALDGLKRPDVYTWRQCGTGA